MSSTRVIQWIREGYDVVAYNGIVSLNIESISRSINKNKSSFYHYFGDLENFISELLIHHINQIDEFANRASNCKSLRPDLLHLFIEYKSDLFFHKQLRIHRDNPEFKKCFEKAFEKVDAAIIDKWTSFLGFENHRFFAKSFLHLISENFLLKITPTTFDYKWLDNYLKEIGVFLLQMNIKSVK